MPDGYMDLITTSRRTFFLIPRKTTSGEWLWLKFGYEIMHRRKFSDIPSSYPNMTMTEQEYIIAKLKGTV